MAWRIKPLFDRVLLKRLVGAGDIVSVDKDGVGKTKGGLEVPQSAMQQRTEYEVVAVGPECKYLKAGTRVLVGEYTYLEYLGHVLLYEEEILAELEDMAEGGEDEKPVDTTSSTAVQESP